MSRPDAAGPDGAAGAAARVLVVCTANVCRSPTTALLLHQRLRATGADIAVALQTAGTDADPGAGFCPVAADLVGPAAGRLLDGHASHLLTRADLEEADLVLVMERAHRAAVVALSPGAGLRTFTLREAAALAGALGQRLGDGRGQPGGRPGRDVPGLVRAMHAARGTVVPAAHPRPLGDRLQRASRVDPLDVPDAHVRRRTTHAQVLALLQEGVHGWVAGLVGPARRRA